MREVQAIKEMPRWAKMIVSILGSGRALDDTDIKRIKTNHRIGDRRIAEFIGLYMQAMEAAKEALLIREVLHNQPLPEGVDEAEIVG